MNKLRVCFLGSGDAFGSGGKLQACIFIQSDVSNFLLDCGTTCLIGMRRYNVDPNKVEMIILSHLHGDHFGGIPFFILDAQLVSKRSEPLRIVGPVGTEKRIKESMEVMFPGSTNVPQKYSLEIHEIEPGANQKINGVTISAQEAVHPSGAASLSLRLELAGRVIAYSGDTEWNENLLTIGKGADVFITECYNYDRKVKNHMDYDSLHKHIEALGAKKVILTHMSSNMLGNLSAIAYDYADDGSVFEI